MKKILQTLLSAVIVLATFFISVSPVSAETYTIKMGADNGTLKFVPDTVTVKPGDTIKWVNNKLSPHNAVFDITKVPSEMAKSLSKKDLLFAAGASYEVTIPTDAASGEYAYYCEPHRGAGMAGKIIVQ